MLAIVLALAASASWGLGDFLGGLTSRRLHVLTVLVVQHLHPDFVPGLVAWMTRESGLPVRVAEHGATLDPGAVYIAAGGRHLRLGPDRRIVLDAQPATLHRPSADQTSAPPLAT